MKCLLFLPLLISTVWAQPSSSSAAAVENRSVQVSVDFTVVGWDSDVSGLAYQQKGAEKPLKIPEFQRSQVYHYTGPQEMGIYAANAKPVAPGVDPKGAETPVAIVRFEPGMTSVTILLAKSAAGYDSIVIPDDVGNFPVGQARLQNLSRYPVAVRFNQREPFALKPGEIRFVDPAGLILDSEMAYNKDGAWVSLPRSYIPVPSGHQTAIFFLQSDAGYFKTVDGRGTGDLQITTLRRKPEIAGAQVAVGRAN